MVIEDLKMLNSKRGSCKSQLTIFRKHLDTLPEEITYDQKIVLDSRLIHLETIFHRFQDIQDEIDVLSEQDTATTDREAFQDEYYALLSRSKVLLAEYERNLHDSSSASQYNTPNHIQLPKIHMPTFNGDLFRWREFEDTFSALVDARDDLSEAEKLFYLKLSLQGPAKTIVASLQQTNNNYAIAWDLLRKRYSNKRRIVRSHVKEIMDLPLITKESREHLTTMINVAEENLQGLQALGEDVDKWDALIVPILESKLDSQTKREWDTTLNSRDHTNEELPTFSEFVEFLISKRNTLEDLTKSTTLPKFKSAPSKQPSSSSSRNLIATEQTCSLCSGTHHISVCETLLQSSVNDRIEKVKALRLCLNCLRKGHYLHDCKSKFTCRTCHKRHHSILHLPSLEKPEPEYSSNLASTTTCHVTPQVILPTAIIFCRNKHSKLVETRIALDCGAQSNFVTEQHLNTLQLDAFATNISISGITNDQEHVAHAARITIQSRLNKYSTTRTFLIRKQIASELPNRTFEFRHLNIPNNLILADPTFNQSSRIDMLVGAELFFELLCIGQVRLGSNGPILQKTKFGWIVSGMLTSQQPHEAVNLLSLEALNDKVSNFWKIDEFLESAPYRTKQEIFCEQHFVLNTTRNSEGTFIVRIPFKQQPTELGNNLDAATQRLRSMEVKFSKNPEFGELYHEFMNEYLKLEHMSLAEPTTENNYFLPHHGILKQSSSTTKLRVVFDGSSRSDIGTSLNDAQCIGPKIQRDLFSILSRFRTHRYVITADVSMMYRRILVHEDDRRFQQIIWRDDPTRPCERYTLNTITYGTSSAPFLALRTLFELASQNARLFPREAEIIKGDFYVDDLITGANSLDELLTIQRNLISITQSANLPLRKWCSNDPRLLQNIESLASTQHFSILQNEAIIKVLGLQWNPHSDTFNYSSSFKAPPSESVTKRIVLSLTSKIFDPLGLISPIVVVPKLILQSIWKQGLSWDESLPLDLHAQWTAFIESLESLQELQIPRHLCSNTSLCIELHGFSDASEIAYGACAYLRCISQHGVITSHLIASKS